MDSSFSTLDGHNVVNLVFAGTFLFTVLYFVSIISRRPDIAPFAELPNNATLHVCKQLVFEFPDIVHTRQDQEFWDYLKTYWAAQAQAPKPALVARPRNSKEVSSIIKILARSITPSSTSDEVHFAIRSGGYSPVRGFANVESGIVIDLSQIRNIALSGDGKLVTIGPGVSWGKVYRELENFGLAVAGGRISGAGVGGLALGGGLSFFSPQVGFVCDNIVSFEVVLADGSIVTASDDSPHADLATALRGGGNNFGIVTKFTARTFPQTKVWMGYCFHWPSATERLIQAYFDYARPQGFDQKATCMLVMAWVPWLPFHLPITCMNYAEPTPHPLALRKFSKEKRFWSNVRVRSLAKATDLVASMSPPHRQDLFHTTTFENNLEVMHEAHAAFKESCSGISKVSGVSWSIVFQPVVPSATLHHRTNAMGIDTDKTLTVVHIAADWNRSKDFGTVHKAAQDLLHRIEGFARQRGVYHPFKFANYCSASQNPYPGYGIDRQRFLQETSRKYDPNGIFQTAVPGGHKVMAN